jgi:hypothetical protein
MRLVCGLAVGFERRFLVQAKLAFCRFLAVPPEDI